MFRVTLEVHTLPMHFNSMSENEDFIYEVKQAIDKVIQDHAFEFSLDHCIEYIEVS
jgi:hypothetical protein